MAYIRCYTTHLSSDYTNKSFSGIPTNRNATRDFLPTAHLRNQFSLVQSVLSKSKYLLKYFLGESRAGEKVRLEHLPSVYCQTMD